MAFVFDVTSAGASLVSGYQYFCGANILVNIEGWPVTECAGLNMQIQESKLPVYGYSSRFFDAVARGRVIVTGSLLINYVHQDYLFRLIDLAIKDNDPRRVVEITTAAEELRDQLDIPAQSDALFGAVYQEYFRNVGIVDASKQKYWDFPTLGQTTSFEQIQNPNPHDSFGGLTIDVTFGENSTRTNYLGLTAFRLHDVYFTGRGMPIKIDEETIVEEYSFFGRNLTSLVPSHIVVQSTTANGQPSVNPEFNVIQSTQSQP